MFGFLAFVVSVAVASAAWVQVHIARQKLVLDLFDKRYAVYQAFRSASGYHNGEGYGDVNAWFRVTAATYEMEYLFGDDVARTLDELRREGLKESQARRLLNRDDLSPKRREALAIQQELSTNAYDQLLKDLYEALMPYLRMDQKLPRSPRQWLADAWRNRPDGTT